MMVITKAGFFPLVLAEEFDTDILRCG